MAQVLSPYVRVRPNAFCVALISSLIAFALITNTTAFSATNGNRATVGYTVSVLTPANAPEAYNTAQGLVQWHSGLPVPTADTIKISSQVTAGNASITSLIVSVDGKASPAVTASPWMYALPGGALSAGSHTISVAVNLDHHNATAVLPLAITTVQQLPPGFMAVPTAPAASSVKGVQQVLNQGSVSTVDPVATVIAPPVVGANAVQTTDPGVILTFTDNSASDQYGADQPVDVNGNLTVNVKPAAGSVDKNFVFSIVRNGNIVYSSSALNVVKLTGINLQAENNNSPGLYPGNVQLYVWGIDDSGNYSAPVITTFNISVDESAQVKP